MMEIIREELSLNNTLNKIFELYPDGIAVKDSDLRYTSVNKAYCKIFQTDEESDFIGKIGNKCFSIENLKLINNADNEIKLRHQPISYVINTAHGKLLNVTSSPIIHNAKFNGVITIVRDITHEESIIEQFVDKHFEDLNTEKQLQIQRENFVATIGHDLKNPIIAQIRSLELLIKGSFGELTQSQLDIAGMILDSCRYMNGILSCLLETYRNYGGAIRLNFNEFALNELVEECISEMLYVAKDKNLNIGFNANGILNIIADRIQIKRVIMNMLSNGIKYAYKNSEIKLFLDDNGQGKIIFELENKSPYIPENKQKEIFARYVSYAGMHRELGIGLGLYVSKKIIESHSGTMYVRSSKEDRNVFGFKIPKFQKSECRKSVYF